MKRAIDDHMVMVEKQARAGSDTMSLAVRKALADLKLFENLEAATPNTGNDVQQRFPSYVIPAPKRQLRSRTLAWVNTLNKNRSAALRKVIDVLSNNASAFDSFVFKTEGETNVCRREIVEEALAPSSTATVQRHINTISALVAACGGTLPSSEDELCGGLRKLAQAG
jgi:hypothetical protein